MIGEHTRLWVRNVGSGWTLYSGAIPIGTFESEKMAELAMLIRITMYVFNDEGITPKNWMNNG